MNTPRPTDRPTDRRVYDPNVTVAEYLDAALNEMPRRPRPKSATRDNRAFGWGLVTGVVIAVLLAWAFIAVTDEAAAEPPVPRCTDAIADAGGVCHGEPLPPCATEDSVGCYWDARTMGNGQGRSYTVEPDGTVSYIP